MSATIGNTFLLTIVIPTLNRVALLDQTINALLDEIEGFESEVELLVINNASDDETEKYLQEKSIASALKHISFTERVNIDDSFLRCVNNSNGQFINIFGDDDLPFPGYVKRLLRIIKTNFNLGLIYQNRLIGDERLINIGEVAHAGLGLAERSFNCAEFIKEFTHWPGFVTAIVFHRDCWVKGDWCYSDQFLGYKFLGRIYAGLGSAKCIFVGSPCLVQRRGVQAWKSEWPRYWLVNMPSLLESLENNGVTQGALASWKSKEVPLKRVFIDCLVAKAYLYKISDPFWNVAAHFQSLSRKFAIQLIRFIVPTFLMRLIYFSSGKYKCQ